jgi:hypothetical protein
VWQAPSVFGALFLLQRLKKKARLGDTLAAN